MLREDKLFKLIDIFITCDDFCNALTHWQTQQGCRPTTRKSDLSDSEMLAITIFYHYSGHNRGAGAMFSVLLPELSPDAVDPLLPQPD